METTFNVVAVFQVWENYGAHAWDGKGSCPQYWKAKGGHEVVVKEGLSISEAAELGSEGLHNMVMDYVNAGAEDREVHDSEYFRFDLIDFSLEEMSESVVEKVYEAVVAERDREYGWIVFNADKYDMSEKTMEWALAVLLERGMIEYNAETAKWGNAYIDVVGEAVAA